MNNISSTGKWIILAVVILVAIFAIWYVSGSNVTTPPLNTAGNPTGTATATPPPTGTTGGTSAGTQTGSKTPTNSGTKTTGSTGYTAPKSSITLLTPVPNDTWVAETQNTVQWSKAPGVTGQIDLLSATTSQLVGVILNQIGPNQTSFTWNTRDLLQSRTSPVKFTVTPGRYLIRLSFDGNNLPSITSAPFSIVPGAPPIK